MGKDGIVVLKDSVVYCGKGYPTQFFAIVQRPIITNDAWVRQLSSCRDISDLNGVLLFRGAQSDLEKSLRVFEHETCGSGASQDIYILCMKQILKLLECMADIMDKKMHKITEVMKTAEKDIKKGKQATAAHVLKKAETANEKLVKVDKEVRDPLIEKCKKSMKKGK